MKYQVIQTEVSTPWWQWIPPFTLLAASRFPYMVFATNTQYPTGRIHHVYATKWYAKRAAKKLSLKDALDHCATVVHEIQS